MGDVYRELVLGWCRSLANQKTFFPDGSNARLPRPNPPLAFSDVIFPGLWFLCVASDIDTRRVKMGVLRGAGTRGRGALLSVISFLCVIIPATSIIVETEISIMSDGGAVKEIDTFGFLSGGYAEFDIRSERRGGSSSALHTYIIGCKEVDMYVIEMGAQNACSQLASQNSSDVERCYSFEIDQTTRTKRKVDITATMRVSWAILMCGEGASSFSMEYKFLNPGGEHLGMGYIPLPVMYRTFAVFWSLLFITQVYFGLVTHGRAMTSLHRLFLALPMIKTMHEVVGMFKWTVLSSYGYVPDWVELMSALAISVNEAATYFILVLIARGWLVTRRTLPINEAQSSMTVAIMLFVLNLTYRYYQLNNMTFFALAIMYMVTLAIILSNTARNIRELKMQMMILRQADIDPTATPAHMKESMYRSFQFYVFSFVCTRIFLEMVMLFLHEYPWIGHMFTELLDLFLCVAVGYAFRLRENNPFNTQQGEFSWLPLDPSELMPRNGDTMQLVARMAELGVQISIPPAKIYSTVIQKASAPGRSSSTWRYDNSQCSSIQLLEGPVVVVENPPVYVKGELVENVAIARPLAYSDQCAPEVASVPESGRLLSVVVQSPGDVEMQIPGTPERPRRERT